MTDLDLSQAALRESIIGSQDTFYTMLENYFSYNQSTLEAMKEAIQEGDISKLSTNCNSIQLSAKYIGANHLSNLAKNIVEMCDMNKLEEAKSEYSDFIVEAIKVKKGIRIKMEKLNGNPAPDDQYKDIDLQITVASNYECIIESNNIIKTPQIKFNQLDNHPANNLEPLQGDNESKSNKKKGNHKAKGGCRCYIY